MASIKTSKHATTMLGEPVQFLCVSETKPDVYNDKKGERRCASSSCLPPAPGSEPRTVGQTLRALVSAFPSAW